MAEKKKNQEKMKKKTKPKRLENSRKSEFMKQT